MPMWFRKLIVGTIAVLTLGTVVPTSYLHIPSRGTRDDVQEAQADTLANLPKTRSELQESSEIAQPKTRDEIQEELVTTAIDQAKIQGKRKFGPSVHARIGKQYEDMIVPKFGKAVASMMENLSDDQLKDVAISQNPSPGLGERIIHLYDMNSKESYLKLHVRRDHPPLEGYWFNFHYHTSQDGYTSHRNLAKIYWDKNTPPHWQA